MRAAPCSAVTLAASVFIASRSTVRETPKRASSSASPGSVRQLSDVAPSRWRYRTWAVAGNGAVEYLHVDAGCQSRLTRLQGPERGTPRCLQSDAAAGSNGLNVAPGYASVRIRGGVFKLEVTLSAAAAVGDAVFVKAGTASTEPVLSLVSTDADALLGYVVAPSKASTGAEELKVLLKPGPLA